MISASLMLALVAFVALTAPWLLYPLALRCVWHSRREAHSADEPASMVSVLIPAHNEEAVIVDKIKNTLLTSDWPPSQMEIIVCSDGSEDATDSLVRSFGGRVRLLRNGRRSGKAATLNRLVEAARGDLLVLTDASASLSEGAIRMLADRMRDPAVGVAAARYVVRSDGRRDDAEARYWSFEAWVRREESKRRMLLGASGACVMVRRDLVPTIPTDTVNDDYVIPLLIREAGFEVVWVDDAIASDDPTDGLSSLYHRWVRIAFGNYQMLWRYRRLLSPLRIRLALPLWRKLVRTMTPVWLLLTAVE